MEILSVNINKFGGIHSNGKGEIYDIKIAKQIRNMIVDFLALEENNVVFINETNSVKDNLKSFESLFDADEFIIHKPSNFEEFNKKNSYGCTVAITKKDSVWNEAPSIELINRRSGELSYANKSVVLKNGEHILVGVHMPYDIDYWNEIIRFLKENRQRKVYLVGDLNVFDEGTDRKLKFEELKKEGVIDVWLNRGGDNGHITCETRRRLDYLLSTVSGYSSIRKMSYIDSLRLNGLTDHSGVLFEIER